MELGLGWDLQQQPEPISACTPLCRGPVDIFLHWSGAYLMSIVEEVSNGPIPGSPRRELLSTSYTDSLNSEGNAVALSGQEESLNQDRTSSTVGGDVPVTHKQGNLLKPSLRRGPAPLAEAVSRTGPSPLGGYESTVALRHQGPMKALTLQKKASC
ncbi:hypothetical protein EYF80_002712 [Liparis tanakae]|uniref:Uncharacterized protein n=1 Tax=Liparis tanakae TaxID=230148 RepID=A0A4Z2JA87_9TELE|nr:hypothetical protein EYF80_002712 [Liparis tanakae]